MRQSKATLPLLVLTCCLPLVRAVAQPERSSLQPGIPIERTIARGQTHSFSVRLEQDQFLELLVDQRGIDVVIRVFSPAGKSLDEFDSPNGDHGPESVSLVSNTPGVYRIDVTPLDQVESAPPGRYEIRIVELRRATEQELQAGKNREALKARGLALLVEVAEAIPQIRLPQTRTRAQLQAAQLLWESDPKLAAKFAADAIEGVKQYVANLEAEVGDQDYHQDYQTAMQLRQEVVQVLGSHDPERVLSFLRSTRSLANPDGEKNAQLSPELQLELSLVRQIIATDPKRAFQMAEETLKKGYSYSLAETVDRLRTSDPELAARLARDIAAKLQSEKLLKNSEAAYLAVGLLQRAHTPAWSQQPPARTAAASKPALLSEQEYRDLFQKTLADGLSYSPPATNSYSQERNAAQNILGSLKSMTSELEAYAPGGALAIEKKAIEINKPRDPQAAMWQQYQTTINSGSLDAALESAGQAPPGMREPLYHQVAAKAVAMGDFAGARQILTDHISNPFQRRQALANLEQQMIYSAIGKGKFEEALRGIANLRTSKERALLLSQIINQIGPGQKRATVLNLLETARSLLGPPAQAEGGEQMNALLLLGQAFSRYDSKRGFEIVEPLIDQFNELSTAAVVLNGFGQTYYQDGELIMQNENNVATAAQQLIIALGNLALVNFDRAKTGADRLNPPEVRLAAYLAIAQQAIRGEGGTPSNRRLVRN